MGLQTKDSTKLEKCPFHWVEKHITVLYASCKHSDSYRIITGKEGFVGASNTFIEDIPIFFSLGLTVRSKVAGCWIDMSRIS